MDIRQVENISASVQKPFLTPIEKSILKLQREGKSATQIAEELKLSVRMVQFKLCLLAPSSSLQSEKTYADGPNWKSEDIAYSATKPPDPCGIRYPKVD